MVDQCLNCSTPAGLKLALYHSLVDSDTGSGLISEYSVLSTECWPVVVMLSTLR